MTRSQKSSKIAGMRGLATFLNLNNWLLTAASSLQKWKKSPPFQLHHFSDASQTRFTVPFSYIRIADNSGKTKCSFVMGKSRLAPIKLVTIPRMELSAAVVSTKLERMLRNELSISIDQSFFWSRQKNFWQ